MSIETSETSIEAARPDLGKAAAGARSLRGLVDSLEVGDRIPSERELALQWGVARMTARRAIDIGPQPGRLADH